MKKIMSIPWYIPVLGMIAGFCMIAFSDSIGGSALLIAGLVLLHLSAWIIAASFFLIGIGSFSSVLSSK